MVEYYLPCVASEVLRTYIYDKRYHIYIHISLRILMSVMSISQPPLNNPIHNVGLCSKEVCDGARSVFWNNIPVSYIELTSTHRCMDVGLSKHPSVKRVRVIVVFVAFI